MCWEGHQLRNSQLTGLARARMLVARWIWQTKEVEEIHESDRLQTFPWSCYWISHQFLQVECLSSRNPQTPAQLCLSCAASVIFCVNWLKVIERSTEILGAVAKFSHALSQLKVKQQRGEAFLLSSRVSNPQQNCELIVKTLAIILLLMTPKGSIYSRQDPITLAAVELLANTPRSSNTEVVNALQERLHLEEVPWRQFLFPGRERMEHGWSMEWMVAICRNVWTLVETPSPWIPMAMWLFIDSKWGPSFGDAAPRSLCIEHIEFAAFAPSSTGNMESGIRGLRLSVKWWTLYSCVLKPKALKTLPILFTLTLRSSEKWLFFGVFCICLGFVSEICQEPSPDSFLQPVSAGGTPSSLRRAWASATWQPETAVHTH